MAQRRGFCVQKFAFSPVKLISMVIYIVSPTDLPKILSLGHRSCKSVATHLFWLLCCFVFYSKALGEECKGSAWRFCWRQWKEGDAPNWQESPACRRSQWVFTLQCFGMSLKWSKFYHCSWKYPVWCGLFMCWHLFNIIQIFS